MIIFFYRYWRRTVLSPYRRYNVIVVTVGDDVVSACVCVFFFRRCDFRTPLAETDCRHRKTAVAPQSRLRPRPPRHRVAFRRPSYHYNINTGIIIITIIITVVVAAVVITISFWTGRRVFSSRARASSLRTRRLRLGRGGGGGGGKRHGVTNTVAVCRRYNGRGIRTPGGRVRRVDTTATRGRTPPPSRPSAGTGPRARVGGRRSSWRPPVVWLAYNWLRPTDRSRRVNR